MDGYMNMPSISLPTVYIVEAQGILVRSLTAIFSGLNVPVAYVSADLDEEYLRLHRPGLVFIDTDYLAGGLRNTLRRAAAASQESCVVLFCARMSHTQSQIRTSPQVKLVIPKSAGSPTIRRMLTDIFNDLACK